MNFRLWLNACAELPYGEKTPWSLKLLLAKLKWLRGWLILSITFCCLTFRVMCFMLSLVPVLICKLPPLKAKWKKKSGSVDDAQKIQQSPLSEDCWVVTYQNQLLEDELVGAGANKCNCFNIQLKKKLNSSPLRLKAFLEVVLDNTGHCSKGWLDRYVMIHDVQS